MGSSSQPDEAKKWCAVTGGRGFMARHLVAALLRSGEWRVRVTDLAPTVVLGRGETEEVLGDGLRDGRAVYSQADVCNLDQFVEAFEGVDVVFHTASADPMKNNLQLHYRVNVEGTKSVIDACKIRKVKRLVYTSSSVVVFDGVHGLFDINESLAYPDKFIIGDGKNYDDFIYVENVVHGHLCAEKVLSTEEGAMRSGGKAYFITNMEPMNFWDFIYMIHEELGYKRPLKIRIPSFVIIPVSYLVEWVYMVSCHFGVHKRQILTPAMVKYVTLNRTFSCTRAVKELGYKPIVTLKNGVKKAIQSYNP